MNENVAECDQYHPAIAVNGSGNFVVVWEDYRNGDPDIYAQRYTSSGATQGANFRVNDDTGSSWQRYPAIAVDRGRNFVVVWEDHRNVYWDICAQRYSSSSAKEGANFRVNDDTGSPRQEFPAIAVDGGGNFVVVWEDGRNGNANIYAQLFDSMGQKIGSSYRVNNDTGTKDRLYPDVKLVNGHIYYAWQDNRIEGQGYDIFARVDRFNFAPAAPGLSSPQNNSTITTAKPALTFTVPADDNNDPLHFEVEISHNSSFTSPITGRPFESKNNPCGFSPTPPLASGTGTCSFTMPTALTNGDYWWRVSGWDGTVYGATSTEWKFTIGSAPAVTTTAASNVTANSAQLNGTVNPNGLTATVKFQYGTSTSYGGEIAATPGSVSGSSATQVTASPSGLLPYTTYNYRLVATNRVGTTYGEDQSFTTLFIYPSTYTLSHIVNFPSYARGSDYQPTDYRIVGLSGASNARLPDLIPGVHSMDLQAYWDNGAASDYFVPYDGSATFHFSVGRAFWLMHKGPWSATATVPSAPLNAANQAEIPLHPGWNLITNPFITAIPWAEVQQANATTQPLWSFNGFFATSSNFSPYQGYYFYER